MKNKLGPSGVLIGLVVMIMMSGLASATSDRAPAGISNQQAIAAGLIGSKIEAGTLPATKMASASSVTATSRCNTQTNYVYLKNAVGAVIWKYYQNVYWCYDGTKILSKSYNAWGQIELPINLPGTWLYDKVIAATPGGGVGKSYYSITTKGRFTYNLLGAIIQEKYPWIGQKVYANGKIDFTWGM